MSYLIERGHAHASNVLSKCQLRYITKHGIDESFQKWGIEYGLTVYIRAAKSESQLIKVLEDPNHRSYTTIFNSLNSILPGNTCGIILGDYAYIANKGVGEHQRILWEHILNRNLEKRAEINKVLDENINNQGLGDGQFKTWENFRFRSESETRIASALDKIKGALFFPNCKARVGPPDGRLNREPDFLVCYRGKWGILEVDGEPFHPATRTVEDHERDRLFRLHGVRVVEHFDAAECFENPDGVIRKFLYILSQS
jgi:hypothetical protein